MKLPINCRHRNFALELVDTRGTSIPTGWKLSFLGTLIEKKKKITGEKAVVISFRNRKRMMMVSEQGTQIHPEDV